VVLVVPLALAFFSLAPRGLVVVVLLLLLLVSGGGCSGRSRRHGRGTAAAGRGQLLVETGRALHRRPLVPQVLAAGRRGRVVYAA